jgi:DNA invertase Pin-like site-specific DNA recombinase
MSSSVSTEAAIWVRVSTDRQHEDNQIPDLERLCRHRGWAIARRYEVTDASAFRGEHRQALHQMLDDAHRGEFSVLVVWAVDRLCRQGIEDLLRLVRELRERNVCLVSYQEPWLNGSDATTELLAAVAAWVARQESVRRSERIRAGLARRRARGEPMGGAASRRGKDKHPRRTEGYSQAWARRKAAQ